MTAVQMVVGLVPMPAVGIAPEGNPLGHQPVLGRWTHGG
jgi:hypothetical protein